MSGGRRTRALPYRELDPPCRRLLMPPRGQALSHGVPVVTLPADLIRGRFALAIYKQMGYSGLVADDLEVRMYAIFHTIHDVGQY